MGGWGERGEGKKGQGGKEEEGWARRGWKCGACNLTSSDFDIFFMELKTTQRHRETERRWA